MQVLEANRLSTLSGDGLDHVDGAGVRAPARDRYLAQPPGTGSDLDVAQLRTQPQPCVKVAECRREPAEVVLVLRGAQVEILGVAGGAV